MSLPRKSSRSPRSGLTLLWVAGVSSVAAGCVAYVAELWLIVIAVLGGWLRVTMWIATYLLHALPERVAATALDEGWRSPGWRGEALVRDDLLALTEKRPLVVRRALRIVRARQQDAGQRAVALDRLNSIRAELACRASLRRTQRLRTIIAPVIFAVALGAVALLALSDLTPGPTLPYPWRSGVGLVAAAATGSLLTSVAQRNQVPR